MQRKHKSLIALAAAAGALTVATVSALNTQEEYPQPTAHHEMILSGVGEYEGTLTSYFPGAPTEPVAASESVVGIGPFWTQSTFECLFMGMPYTGTGCVGYDSNQEKFVGTWIDSMSTYLAIMEGEYDEESGKLLMSWEAPGMTGEMEQHRSETVRTDDAYTITFFMGEGDAEAKSMVIDMKRKTAKPVEAGAGR